MGLIAKPGPSFIWPGLPGSPWGLLGDLEHILEALWASSFSSFHRGGGCSQVTPLLSSDQGPSHRLPAPGPGGHVLPAACGGFASRTEPGFVFCLRCVMRVGVGTHSPDATAGSHNPDTEAGFSGNPPRQQQKANGKQGFRQLQRLPLASKPRRWAGTAEKQGDISAPGLPEVSGGVHRPNTPEDGRGRSQASPPHWDRILPRADCPAGQHFLHSHPFSYKVTDVGLFLFLIQSSDSLWDLPKATQSVNDGAEKTHS